ncbi:hypothetical protein VNO77_08372 [Canavalia gladiata]|uniref:Uncharacterized protein n=1 Tax=Canavalia gladiata TaxID=3824 RepID=A0AAN9M997_CANGL
MVKVTHVSAVANTEPGMLKSAGGMIIKGFTLHKIMYMVRRLRSRSPVDSISIKTQRKPTMSAMHMHVSWQSSRAKVGNIQMSKGPTINFGSA